MNNMIVDDIILGPPVNVPSAPFLVSRSQTASSLHFLQTDVIGREEGSVPTSPVLAILRV